MMACSGRRSVVSGFKEVVGSWCLRGIQAKELVDFNEFEGVCMKYRVSGRVCRQLMRIGVMETLPVFREILTFNSGLYGEKATGVCSSRRKGLTKTQ